MQAITIKYLGPTNTRGASYKATSSSGKSVTVSKDYEHGEAQNAIRAAKALGAKLGWSGEMVLGSTKDGYVAVFASGDRFVLGGANMARGHRTAHRAGGKRTAKRSSNRAGTPKRSARTGRFLRG